MPMIAPAAPGSEDRPRAIRSAERRRPRSTRHRLVAALFALASLAPQSARADVATADKLFAEGKALMAEGKLSAACSKFEASYDADAALGALLNLADCLERSGRLASAYARWGDAANIAERKNDDRADFAKDRRLALEPKLSIVTLDVQGTLPPDLSIFKGDTKLLVGAFGTALPTDPGSTVIQVVRGQDEVLWETRIELKEIEKKTVVVPIDEIVKQNPAPVKKRAKVEVEVTDPNAGAPEGFWNTQRIAGFAVGGVGLLGAAAGFALGGVAASKSSDLDAECTAGEPRYCTPAGEEIRADAYTFATASTWTLIASGIVAAVGVTVIITAPNDAAKLEDRAFLAPWFAPDGGGVMAGGRF